RTGTAITVASLHTGSFAEGTGVTKPRRVVRRLKATPVTGSGVQPATSTAPAQTETPNVHVPSTAPSTSQVGSPSWQSTPVRPRLATTSGPVTCQAAMQSVRAGPPPATNAGAVVAATKVATAERTEANAVVGTRRCVMRTMEC